MFRFAFAVLTAMVLAGLLFGAASAAVVGLGWLLLVPIVFVFKIMFFFLIFGGIARMVGGKPHRHWGRTSDWQGRQSWRSGRPSWAAPVDLDDKPADDEKFEEWHRMAHARKEVDSWVEFPGENG